MSDQELKPLPKGFLKTVAYTQLCAAIKNDFDIELPMKSGKETTRAIEEMLEVRTPDPMLEELAGALEEWLICVDTPNEWMRCREQAKQVLRKYSKSWRSKNEVQS